MALIVCIFLFLALMIAISLYGYRRYLRPARVYERLGRPVTAPSAVVNIGDEPQKGGCALAVKTCLPAAGSPLGPPPPVSVGVVAVEPAVETVGACSVALPPLSAAAK